MIYPGSSPEFRILMHLDGSQTMQVRYVNESVGYLGLWHDVPVVKEIIDESSNNTSNT